MDAGTRTTNETGPLRKALTGLETSTEYEPLESAFTPKPYLARFAPTIGAPSLNHW